MTEEVVLDAGCIRQVSAPSEGVSLLIDPAQIRLVTGGVDGLANPRPQIGTGEVWQRVKVISFPAGGAA